MRRFILSIALALVVSLNAEAGKGGYVHGYTRSNGTYVNGYYRGPSSTPSSTYTPSYTPTYTPSDSSSDTTDYSVHASKPSFFKRMFTVQKASYETSHAATDSDSTKPSFFTRMFTVQRNADGSIHRSEAAKHAFEKQTGYPDGRPGYVVDHVIPLKEGGADSPENMQWQTISDGKAKDKWE